MTSWDCDHENCELVVRITAAGHRQFRYACPDCGRYVGEWLEENAVPLGARRNARPYDDAADRQAAEKERKRQRKLQEKQDAEWQQKYNEYISTSPAWQEKRRLILQRAKGLCEGCGKLPAQQVHHLNYEHLGDEFLWELRAVCFPCHERLHPKRRGKR
jgi:5-methylcytosine-specific restriction endonuclease McrA